MTSNLPNRFAALLREDDATEGEQSDEDYSTGGYFEGAATPTENSTTTTTTSPSFTIAVGSDFDPENIESTLEGSTAYALNANGEMLAQLRFYSMEELWSEDFHDRMKTEIIIKAATPTPDQVAKILGEPVAATAAAAAVPALQPQPQHSIFDDPYIDLTQDEYAYEYDYQYDYEDGDDYESMNRHMDEYYAAMWAEAEAAGSLDHDSEAATLAAILRIEQEDLEMDLLAEREDADMALAIAFQEQEEEEEAARQRARMQAREQFVAQAAAQAAAGQGNIISGDGGGGSSGSEAWRKVLSNSGAEIPAGLQFHLDNYKALNAPTSTPSSHTNADFPALSTAISSTNATKSSVRYKQPGPYPSPRPALRVHTNKYAADWEQISFTSRHRPNSAPHLPTPSSPSFPNYMENYEGNNINIHSSLIKEDEPLSPGTLAAIRAIDEQVRSLEISGYRVADDDLAQENFLDAVDSAAKKAALLSGEAAQMAADAQGDTIRRGVTVEEFRRMMGVTSAANNRGAAIAGGRADGGRVKRKGENSENDNEGDDNEENDKPEYSRKNIRKLVGDMISAGWRPLPGRGGGHYVYERRVPPTGHKQLLVLPCTPSDCRSIENTHAKLQRLDRDAAEVRRRAAAGLLPLPFGG